MKKLLLALMICASPFRLVAVNWPIKVSANGRYFVDQDNVPWLMVGDSCHHMVSVLPMSDWDTYLSDRAAKGFNAVNAFASCAHGNCPLSGAAQDGTLPFTTGTGQRTYDLSTPNELFWSKIDVLVKSAASQRLTVILAPLPVADYIAAMRASGPEKCFGFGAYLGRRYKDSGNIIWFMGNDFQTWRAVADMNLVKQMMDGILSVDKNHLLLIQLDYLRSYSNQATSSIGAELTADAVYTYYETYDYVLKAYQSSPTLPVFLVEANYEGGNNTHQLTTDAPAVVVRREMYWTMTSGACGHIWGSASVNHMDSNYPGSLNTKATFEVAYLTKLFTSHRWYDLTPDSSHAIVTGGYGASNPDNLNLCTSTYATTAYLADGSLAITYTAASNSLVVAMAKFAHPVAARWFDPSAGTYVMIPGSPFAPTGTHTFATPGMNADGDPDWVLLLEAAAQQ